MNHTFAVRIMENKPFVITIVGAESSGKTVLAKQLAAYFSCPWVPEYSREYLGNLGRAYNEDDLHHIAEGQLEWIMDAIKRESSDVKGELSVGELSVVSDSGETSTVSHEPFSPRPLILRLPDAQPGSPAQQPGVLNVSTQVINDSSLVLSPSSWNVIELLVKNMHRPVVIVDGGMMNLRMWARIKFKLIIPVVEDALKDDVTDLYLLCRPRLEWTSDPLREAPTLLERAWIYNQYLDELMRGEIKTEIIKFRT